MASNSGMVPAITKKAPVAQPSVTSAPVTSGEAEPPISNSKSTPSTISLPKDTTNTLNLSFKNQESTLVTRIMVTTYPLPSKNDIPSTSQKETQDMNFLTKNPIEIQDSMESPEQKIHFEKLSSDQINVSGILPVEKLIQVPNGNLFAQVSGSVNDLQQQIFELNNNNESFEEDDSTAICHICLKCLEKSYMLDCGHIGFCDICSKDVLSKKLPKVPKCPICGKIVKSRLQVYLNIKYKRKRINKEAPELITIT